MPEYQYNGKNLSELSYEEFVELLADAIANEWGPVPLNDYLNAHPHVFEEHPNYWNEVKDRVEQIKSQKANLTM